MSLVTFYLHLGWKLVEALTPIFVDNLRGVEGQLLVGVDADQHG